LTARKRGQYNFREPDTIMDKRPKKPTVALDSLGCKLNQAEIQLLAEQLAAAGYHVVTPEEKADIYVLNTCTVTHVADRKSRHQLNLARRRNPAVRLVAIGCYAERAAGELSCIEGVELVLGNTQKWQLPELLETATPPNPSSLLPTTSLERTRAFLRIQDGCRNFCAYCIVPMVRSREASVPADTLLAQVKARAAAGFKELVLTGTEIGAYRAGSTTLENLLERILVETDVPRLRLSSLQPHHITPGLVALCKDKRLCPHFHLSLQSGSDGVLKRMKRRYTTAEYRSAVALIRGSVPDAAITTDVIVGFPGESEAEFRESGEFCRQMRFARIHVFPFSPRPGTAAAKMPKQVAEKARKERSGLMLTLAGESARVFHQCFIGKTREVLWEQQIGGVWSGLTDNYIKTYVKSAGDLTNRLLPIKLTALYRDGVWGEISRTMTDSASP
jgi:threonylcarbamoyladenosine tRNA methylthiotransferase MtaB